MLRIDPLVPEDVPAVMAIVRSLPAWFDAKAQRAIPIDALHQRALIARAWGFEEFMRVRTSSPECPEELRLRLRLPPAG